jgi:DNA-binding transcriptional LysR family regulator
MLPLAAQRAFEVVRWTIRVWTAGDELAVSHTAGSRKVRNLQSNLGSALICPSGGGVELKREGRSFFDELKSALGVLKPPQRTVRIW